MGAPKKNLAQLMLEDKLISANDLQKAKERQKREGGRITTNLVQMGAVDDNEMSEFLAKAHNLPVIDLKAFEIPTNVIQLVNANICRKLKVIPTSKFGNRLVVAFANPDNYFAVEDLSHITRCKIEVVVASEQAIMDAIEKYYGDGTNLKQVISQMEELESSSGLNDDDSEISIVFDGDTENEDGPIIKFVNHMLVDAIKRKASDIHVEPFEKRFRVRFRVDGSLIEAIEPPADTASAIVSRIKIIAKMDISEKRRPQDGRIRVKPKGKTPVDFRVSSIPTMYGESIVLRLLDKSNLQQDINSLGFNTEQMAVVKDTLNQPQGMVLVTGPTGSGKTTTLYSFIKELNTPNRKILTAENPVEFNLDGIIQTQIQSEIDYNFSDALRTFLRQDPEVIMVGEIRDLETAEIAYKASATGHLVLSTLHTNDAASTITRLLDMGLPAYVVAESTSLVIAQRLIKTVCNSCKSPHKVEEKLLLNLGVPADEVEEYNNLQKGHGCGKCNGTGLQGRAPIFEILNVNNSVKEAIFRGDAPLQIKKQAMASNGMVTLRQSALAKLKKGETTIDQVIAASMADEV